MQPDFWITEAPFFLLLGADHLNTLGIQETVLGSPDTKALPLLGRVAQPLQFLDFKRTLTTKGSHQLQKTHLKLKNGDEITYPTV